MRTFDQVYGVDFSGGAMAGRNIWVARLEPVPRPRKGRPTVRLSELFSLEAHVGQPEREKALQGLVQLIASSPPSVWGLDFPFGLPIELSAMGDGWMTQIEFLRRWDGDAKLFGTWCVGQARARGGALHIRRTTDSEVKTPFDCYHYRIIYQTFHGMRDVLSPLVADTTTAVLPFQYDRLPAAEHAVVEACPSSTLKRLQLPFQNYKEPAAAKVSAAKRRTRLAILAGIELLLDIDPVHRKTAMQNPGGDALDAIIAAVGTWQRFHAADHPAVQRHPRYHREGYIFA